ncbi:MAG: flavin reductase [Anaerolineales bacterium]
MAKSGEGLRRVMRRWASGVCLVTSQEGAQREGMIVSSFSSVSLEPPLVVVVMETESLTLKMI